MPVLKYKNSIVFLDFNDEITRHEYESKKKIAMAHILSHRKLTIIVSKVLTINVMYDNTFIISKVISKIFY